MHLSIVFVETAADADLVWARDRVSVWADEHGRTRFLAHPMYHAFFQIVDYAQLRAQINGAISLA